MGYEVSDYLGMAPERYKFDMLMSVFRAYEWLHETDQCSHGFKFFKTALMVLGGFHALRMSYRGAMWAYTKYVTSKESGEVKSGKAISDK